MTIDAHGQGISGYEFSGGLFLSELSVRIRTPHSDPEREGKGS